MSVVVRKLRSLLSHARTPTRLGPALRRNFAQARGALNRRGRFTYESPLGVQFVCFTDNATSLQLFVQGYQEEAEIEIARAWLRPRDRCIDVGANVGLLAAAFSAAVGRGGAVLALEPSPIAFARLTEAVRELELTNTIAVACCAADYEGLTPFFVACSPHAEAEEESIRVSSDRQHDFRQSVVPCVRVDALCSTAEGFETPALLKLDVEGAEPLVLAGAERILTAGTPPLVIAEIHRTALANYSYDPCSILTHLPANRFERFFIPRSVSDASDVRQHGRVYPLVDPAQLPIYSNLIAIPLDGWQEDRRESVRQAIARY